MDKGAWRAMVHVVTKSRTQLRTEEPQQQRYLQMTGKENGSDFSKIQVYISSYFKILERVSKELGLASLETGTQAPSLSLLQYVSCHSQNHNMILDGCQSSSHCFCIPAKKGIENGASFT